MRFLSSFLLLEICLYRSFEVYAGECTWRQSPHNLSPNLQHTSSNLVFSSFEETKQDCIPSKKCLGIFGPTLLTNDSVYRVIESLENEENENDFLNSTWIKICKDCQRYFIHFTSTELQNQKNNAMYVEIPWEFEKQITSLTICFWIKNSANPERSFDGELLAIFDKDESKKILSISGNKKLRALFLTLERGIQFEFWISAFLSNQWNEICSTISSSETVAALYVNGEAVGAEANHKLKSFVIPDTVNIFVGEKQNCNLEECNFFNNFHGSMYGLNMWDISLSEKEITNNYEKQNTDCECILGNIMSFTPWSNSNDISKSKNHTLKIFGRASVSAFDQAEGNIEIFGISNSCLILISEEETTSFVTVNNRFTQNTNSKSSMIDIIVPLCCAIAIIIILACFILWFLCCKRQNKQNIVLQSDAKITEYVDLPPETTKASRHKVIKNKYVDENNKPRTRQQRNDLPEVKEHINLSFDPHHRATNDSPTFSRKQSTIHREHIYEEIHPKYVPSILKNCSINERNKPDVDTKEKNGDNFSTQVYYSLPPEDNSRAPMDSLYELPLESTFINSLATGDIH